MSHSGRGQAAGKSAACPVVLDIHKQSARVFQGFLDADAEGHGIFAIDHSAIILFTNILQAAILAFSAAISSKIALSGLLAIQINAK
jgi:hypothetical protein